MSSQEVGFHTTGQSIPCRSFRNFHKDLHTGTCTTDLSRKNTHTQNQTDLGGPKSSADFVKARSTQSVRMRSNSFHRYVCAICQNPCD